MTAEVDICRFIDNPHPATAKFLEYAVMRDDFSNYASAMNSAIVGCDPRLVNYSLFCPRPASWCMRGFWRSSIAGILNQVGESERKVVTVAVATATDALQPSTIGSGNGVGLRAGTFESTVDASGNQATALKPFTNPHVNQRG